MENQNTVETQGAIGTVGAILAKRPRLRPLIRRVSVKYGGDKHIELERFIKFVFVGIIGTVVDFVLFNLLLKFVFHATRSDTMLVLIAEVISFTIAVINNFIWNRYWTYPDSRSRSIAFQLVQFFVVNIFGLAIRSVIVALLAVPFATLVLGLPISTLNRFSINPNSAAIIGDNMDLIASISVVMLWNFFVNRYWTYNDVK